MLRRARCGLSRRDASAALRGIRAGFAARVSNGTGKSEQGRAAGLVHDAIKRGQVGEEQLAQRAVRLYRDFLRLSRRDAGLRDMVVSNFRENANVDKGNLQKIDFLIRNGEKKLRLAQATGFRGVATAGVRKP